MMTKSLIQSDDNTQQAWVVFTGKTDIKYLKILKSGFRHCFVIINDGQRWMSIDPLAPYTDIQIYHHIDSIFDLPQWLKQRGYTIIKSNINKNHTQQAPWMFSTCVESIKRILGIHHRFVVTPWQLYCHLNKQDTKGDFNGQH